MAISSTYYLNAPSLGSATAVFSNSTLTTLAADGFYSDSVISRQQVSGVLLPQQVCTAVPEDVANLHWSFTEGAIFTGTIGQMDLYVNGIMIVSNIGTSSGDWTVYEGDEIYVDIFCSGCSSPSIKANAYVLDIIADASCENNSTNLTTTTYTVTNADLGTTLSLRTFAICSDGCV